MAKVEIINIGDELLIGQVVNTNAAEMSKMLNSAGFDVIRISVIGDSGNEIRKSVTEALQNANIVIITGGLGPTKDDITKKVLAEIFDSQLVMNDSVYHHIEKMFALKGYEFTETNQAQALVPDKCQVIHNPVGTAPGMCFEKEGKLLFSMPGVPFEMRKMMPEVIQIMTQHFQVEAIEHRTLLYGGIGESFLSDKLEDFEAQLPSFIKLAYLPQAGVLRLRLTAKGTNKELINNEIDIQKEKLLQLTQEYFIGFEANSIAITLGEQLKKAGKTIATAESCTGGNIAHQITLVPGSSQYFKGSVVCYANEVKINTLGVSFQDIQQYGAVSETVARQMAEGARKRLNTDFAIATTGVAGPDGGSDEKPVGTVWIAVADSTGTIAKKCFFPSTRENFIDRTSNHAILMLLHRLGELYDNK